MLEIKALLLRSYENIQHLTIPKTTKRKVCSAYVTDWEPSSKWQFVKNVYAVIPYCI
jgi:hypothetical protein